jgi:hypothetical protein
MSRGHGEAPSGSYPDGASLLPRRACVVSVSLATRGQTDIRVFAYGRTGFGWIASACLVSSVDPSGSAHSCVAGRSTRCDHRTGGGSRSGDGQSSMTASDQHQPASSRAIATLATVDRLRRARKPTHRSPTLTEHRGLPPLSDRPSRRSLLGSPRTWVSGAPARNPQLNAEGHPYRLASITEAGHHQPRGHPR